MGTPSSSAAAERVWVAMQGFVEANHRTGAIRDALGLGLGAGRVKVLRRLRDGPLTLREIAEAHGVDAPYATIIVDKLEGLGLVERRPHPADRRRKLVVLTAAGRDAAALADELHAQPPAALGALSDRELAQLDALLARLG